MNTPSSLADIVYIYVVTSEKTSVFQQACPCIMWQTESHVPARCMLHTPSPAELHLCSPSWELPCVPAFDDRRKNYMSARDATSAA